MKKVTLKNPIFAVLLLLTVVTLCVMYLISQGLTLYLAAIMEAFSTLATLLVGSYAFLLYNKQKADAKRDVANTLLLEIQSAEKVLRLAQKYLEKTIPELPYDTISMPSKSWDINKYLFVGDFDTNEWDAINSFYSTCALFDESVKTNASYFQKNEEQIRVNIQQRAAQLTKHFSHKINKATTQDEKQKIRSDLKTSIEADTDLYLYAVTEYRPIKPIGDAKLCIEILKLNISLPSAISQLKKLASRGL
jgi:hypothetical protein